MAETYNVTPENSPVTNVALNADDMMNIYSGGTATATTIHDGGYLNVFSGGMADQTNVSAWMDILDGGVANNTTILGNGWVTVSSGGVANTVLVSSGGLIDISSDGMVKDATVNANGELYISGKVTGQITFADGAVVSSYEGGIIDFDISELSPGNTALLNKLSILKGARDYTLTVGGSQATGKYTLAGGVPSFNKSITVVDTLGTELGTFSVAGGETKIGGVNYTLALDGSNLTVTVKGIEADLTGDLNTKYDLAAGMVAANVNVNENGELNVLNGGAANNTTVNSKGELNVSAGGTANNTTVNYWGEMYVSAGGTADNTTVNSAGRLNVSAGGTANNTTVNGMLLVDSGGTANDVTIVNKGILHVDGTATNIVWTPCEGYVYVYEGASATFATKYSGVYFGSDGKLLESAAAMDGKTVGSDCEMYVMDGGVATNTASEDGYLYVWSGGVANNTTVNNGWLNVSSGGVANDTIVNANGSLAVSYGGVANDTIVNANGDLYVSAGGTAEDTTVNGGAYFYINSGGTATQVRENGGYVNVDANADVTFASNTITGLVFSTVATIHSGTTATHATVKTGPVFVYGGGIVSDTAVEAGLHLEGGVATDTTINSGGSFYVFSGGVADNTTVNNGGVFQLYNYDDIANNTTVNDGGYFYVAGYNTANGVVVSSGGSLYLTGKLTGNAVFETGAIVDVSGATVDFDLTQTTPGTDPLVNDLSFVMSSSTTYTLTVNGTVVNGTYSLAGGATGFDKTITVNNTLGEGIGTLSVGDVEKEIVGMQFSLALTGSDLTVTVAGGSEPDTTAPTVSNIQASITTPTNQNVTVTADFDDDVALKSRLYRLEGDSDWSAYPEGGVVVMENTTVYFKAVDTSGNECKPKFITIDNIDKVAPTITGITPSTTAPATSVTVTAVFDDDVELSTTLYRIGDGGWFNYHLEGVTVTENTTVSFKATDTAGNATTASYEVTNITGGGSVDLTGDLSDSYELTAGKVASSVNILNGGNLEVFEGGFTSQTTVNSGGDLAVSEGGVADVVTVNFGGDLYVRNGGVATLVKENGGYASVNDGATATFVSNSFGGYVYNNADDWCTIHSGTTGTDLTVGNKGRIYVYSGGIASDTTVNDKGIVEGNSGGLIDGVVVNSGGSLLIYNGAKLTGQMTFASGAEVIPFVGSILDFDLTQTEPGSPALVNDLSILMGTPTYTITVDNSQALGTYKLAGGAAGFDKPITVRNIYGEIGCTLTVDGGTTKLGDVYLTLALSGSDLTFTISEDSGGGIIPDNKPDDGTNDYLYKKKADPEWNNANIHVTNEITGNGEVLLDMPGTIDTEDGWHNLFGHDKDNMDTGDVAQVEVNDPAKLTFTIDSNAAGTFYVYEDGFDKKGNRKMITVKKVTVKAGKLATLKDVCLTSTGKYYVAMTAKNVKKVGTEGLYNVNVTESKFFVDADEGTNNTAKDYWQIGIGRGSESKLIILDGSSMEGSTEFKNFVGFTDGKDYAKLDLTDSAYLKFHVTGEGDGKAKFTIWKQTKGTTGKLSKVTSVSLPAKKVYDATTKAQFLDTDKFTYYVSMECSDEAKGKSVYYNVQITDDAVFFDSDDDGKNNILYDKKAKSFYVEDANHHFESTTIGTETKVKLDTDPVADTDWENFVGYQDATDYAKIKLTGNGNLSFHIEATGDATFTVYRKGEDKKGNDTLETIQTAKLAVASGASKTEKDIQISGLTAGEYYVSMAAKNTKATDKGSVFYNVTATLDVPLTSALEMPMAEASYADSVQDKLFGESGNGLLASL